MHPEITQKMSGKCSICKMDLVKENEVHSMHQEKDNYYPLFVIIGMIMVVVLTLGLHDQSLGTFSWTKLMMNFMAGFFLVFGGFKLLDLKGFAEAYSTYDLIAKKVKNYGYIYPFIEISLGLIYMLGYQNYLINFFTLVLMFISGLGVAISLLDNKKFQCACLGTIIKVPLTKITLVEDFGMAIMALWMLLK